MNIEDFDAEDEAISSVELDSAEDVKREDEDVDVIKPKASLAIAAQLPTSGQSSGLAPTVLLASSKLNRVTHMTEPEAALGH